MAQIESIHDATTDLMGLWFKQVFGGDEDKKKAHEDNAKTQFPHWAGLFEKHLKANNDGKGYFIGDKLSLADIAVFNIWDQIHSTNPDVLKEFPTLAAHHERIAKNAGIAAWLEKRK